jgi:hypothetical protein
MLIQKIRETADKTKTIGLIVKGATAMFLEGTDPGPENAVALANRSKMGNKRSLASKLAQLSLTPTARPKPLLRKALAWAYLFVTATEGDERRLEPGPFDTELAHVVAAIEADQPGTRGPVN